MTHAPSAIDQLGFVTVDEVQNVFSYEVGKIEEDIAKNGFPLDHKIVMEWMDSIRLRLVQRARFNMDDYVKKNPEVRRQKREDKDANDAQSLKAQETWQERVKVARQEAVREALKG